MSAAKSERLLNLVILLLVARNYTTKEQIRALMEPYRESNDEAFDRMFERDKDDLRALGIPLEVGFVDKFFEDEQGYRIKRDAFELPEIDFTADEVAVLGLAARVWRHAGLAAATSDALVKLKAAGLSFDREQLDQVAPAAGGRGAGVRGDVAGDGPPHPGALRLQPRRASATPPRATSSRGAWSPPRAAGTSRDSTPTGASRGCSGSAGSSRGVTSDGDSGSYTVPEGTDLRALSESLAPRAARPHRRRAGPAGRGQRAATPGRRHRHGRDRTGRHPGLGPARGALRLGDATSPASCWGTPTRWSSSHPPSCGPAVARPPDRRGRRDDAEARR